MPDTTTEAYGLHTREFHLRADMVDVESGIVTGIGVPYDHPVRIRDWAGEYDEQFIAGSLDDDGALAFWRHDEPIGSLAAAADVAGGRHVELRISQTTQGRDALILARDLQEAGRPIQISVRFRDAGDFTVQERDGDVPLITRTRAVALEYSLVPFGAYGAAASATNVRHRPDSEEISMSRPSTATPPSPTQERAAEPDSDHLREEVERLDRVTQRLDGIVQEFARGGAAAPGDRRSIGQFVRDLAAGEDTATASYERALAHRFDETQARAYTGGTIADAPVRDAWVGDLTRIVDTTSGVLARVFSTGTLPDTGEHIEFAELDTNTLQVTQQLAEGDAIPMGNVKLKTRTVPVLTYAGGTELSRQQIERSTLPVLNRHFQAMAVAAGIRKKLALRLAFDSLVASRVALSADAGVVALGATLAAGNASHWTGMLVDAALRYEAMGFPLEGLLVSASVFKKLDTLTVAGDKVLRTGEGNSSGHLDLIGLEGDLVTLPVRLDSGQTGDKAQFINGEALRQYDSALTQLQDEAILNLTKSFAVYRYGAVAAEVPSLVLPVKFA